MSLRDRLKQLASESAIYGIAPIAQRLIAVFLTPFYTRVFSPADYGAISIIDSTFAVLAPLSVLALDSAAFRWFYDATTEDDRRAAVGTWFWTQTCFSVALAAAVVLLPSGTLTALTDRSDTRLLLAVAVASLPFAAFETVLTNHARMHRRPWQALGTMLASSGLTLGLTVLLVLRLRLGVIGIYFAVLATRLVIAAVAVRMVGAWLAPRRFERRLLGAMLRYSLPMVPTALFSWVIALADRFFVARYWNTTEVGLYSIGIAIGAVLTLVTGAFQNAWSAFAFSIKEQPDAPRTYALVLDAYLVGTCFVALGLSVFAPEALRLLTTPDYYPAANVVPWIAIGYVMVGLFQITGIGAMLVRNTRPLFTAFAVAAAVNVVLNFVLIPRYGRLGAAIATLVAQTVLPVYLLYRSQALYPIPYRSWMIAVLPGGTLLLALAVGRLTRDLSLLGGLAVKSLAVLAFAGVAVVASPVRAPLARRLRLALARSAG